jgi:hypothetical protein
MLGAISIVGAGTNIYSSGTALVRYLYVRSSFEVHVQEALKRDSFILKSLFIGECINLFNIGSFFFDTGSPEFGKSPQVLYQACLDPEGHHTFPMYNIKPWNQLIMGLLTIVNISCNLFLYRFLGTISEKSTARSETDKKKNRKRNLVPANIGFSVLGIYIIATCFFLFTYMYKSEHLDNGTRAFMNAAFADTIHCIVSPVVIISGSEGSKMKVKDIIRRKMEMLTYLFKD